MTKSISKCPISIIILQPLSWKISGWAPALRYYSFCKTLHLKCLAVFWMRVCLDNCSVICKVTWCYVLHETHPEFCHIQHSVFSGICTHIQTYSELLRHIHTSDIFRLIQANSGPCVTLAYSKPCHILRPSIFRTGGLFKTRWNIEQTNSEPCYRALFSHIQKYSEPCTMLA